MVAGFMCSLIQPIPSYLNSVVRIKEERAVACLTCSLTRPMLNILKQGGKFHIHGIIICWDCSKTGIEIDNIGDKLYFFMQIDLNAYGQVSRVIARWPSILTYPNLAYGDSYHPTGYNQLG